jgi:hypothetical protein
MRSIPLGTLYCLAVDARDRVVGLVVELAVALDTEEHEGWKDQQHQHEEQQAVVGADELEHGRVKPSRQAPRTSDRGRSKRPHRVGHGILAVAMVGADGLEPPTYAL